IGKDDAVPLVAEQVAGNAQAMRQGGRDHGQTQGPALEAGVFGQDHFLPQLADVGAARAGSVGIGVAGGQVPVPGNAGEATDDPSSSRAMPMVALISLPLASADWARMPRLGKKTALPRAESMSSTAGLAALMVSFNFTAC